MHSCSHRAGSLRGPCLRLQSQLRPLQPRRFPASPERRGGNGKGRPREPCRRDGGRGLPLPRKKERWHPGLPATHRPSLQLPLPISDLPVQAEVAAYRHVQAHTSPLAVVSQTKQQQETSMKFKREIAVTTAQHIHTCLPPLHTPFLPGKEEEGLCCEAAPTQTPFTCPKPYAAVAPPVDAAERRSTAPAWSLAKHPCAGDVQEEPLRVPSPMQGRRVLWICGCR